jgi:short-subunit dehydrogenase
MTIALSETSRSAGARPIALVTGASSGIGLALALEFGRGGHDLVLVARQEDRLRDVAVQLAAVGATAHILPADLADPSAPAALAREVGERGLVIDCLCNNAGFGQQGKFAEQDLTRQLEMIQVNVAALTALTHLFLPAMLTRKHGRILNVASTAAFLPGPLMAVYYATKAFVLSFSYALAEEVRGTGVTVTALCPGPTKTAFADVAGMNHSNLFKGPFVMEVGPVAAAGYAGLMQGKHLVVPGLANKVSAFSARLAPREVLASIAGKLQEP